MMDCKQQTSICHRRPPTASWRLHAGGVAVLACIGLMVLAGRGVAQPITGSVSGSKYYVWGQVSSPGTYSFIASPDILELLSAAGGPTVDADLRRVVLIRMVTQKRTRVNLQALMNKGTVLRLSPGDVVLVPSTPWYNVRENIWILSTTASLFSLALLIMDRAGW